MNKKLLLLLPALAMILVGCNNKKQSSSDPGSSDNPEAVASVVVEPEAKTLEAGETVQLAATVKPFTVSNKEVTWSSDNEALATVDVSGLVTTLEAGTVHIKATSQADTSKSGQSTLTITPAYVYYPLKTPEYEGTYRFGTYQKALSKRIFFNGEFETYPRGKTAEGYENGVDVKLEEGANAGEYYVSFTVGGAKKYLGMTDTHRVGGYENNSSADTVWNWNAELKTVCKTLTDTKTYFPGTYNNYDTISGCDVTMASSDYIFQFLKKYDPVDPTAVSIVEDAVNCYAGATVQLHSECAPEGAMNAKLTWTVLDNEKVHVDRFGLVSVDADAVVDSTATIKATWGTLEGDTCVVTVKEKLNYGTLEAPLTVAEAKTLIDKFPAGSLTAEKIFIKGYISADHPAVSSTVRQDLWLTNDDGSEEKAFELYATYVDESLGEIAANGLVGKQVTATGWAKNYSGTYEFNNKDPQDNYDNGMIKRIEDGTRVATDLYFNTAAFELEQGNSKAVVAKPLPYGATATINYAVSPADQGVTYENGAVVATAGALADDYTLTASVQGSEVTKNLSFTIVVPLTSVGKFNIVCAKGSETTDGATIAGWFSRQTGTLNVTGASGASKVYPGANGGNGDTAWSTGNMLKIGSSSAAGQVTITVSSAVKKIVIKGYAWKNTLVVTMNGVTSDTLKGNLANKANVEAENVGTSEFVLASASTSIAISTNNTSVCITEIEFFAQRVE